MDDASRFELVVGGREVVVDQTSGTIILPGRGSGERALPLQVAAGSGPQGDFFEDENKVDERIFGEF